jgi:sec-independent protein translocase protein TatB
MMREAELEEMEKKWREENERIMREHPVALPYPGADLGTSPNTSPNPGPNPGVQPADGSTALSTGDWSPASTDLGDEPQLPLPDPDTSTRPLP